MLRVIKAVTAALVFIILGSVPVMAAETTAKIPITCKAVGIDEEFTYTISAKEKKAPMPEKTSLKLKNGEKGEFLINYNDPNTWHYEISQNKPNEKNIDYDNKVYSVIVFVGVRQNGKLYTDVSISKKGNNGKSEKCAFVNEIKITPTPHSAKPDTPTKTPTKKPDKSTNQNGGNNNPETYYNPDVPSSTSSSNVGTRQDNTTTIEDQQTPLGKITSVLTGDTREMVPYLIMLVAAVGIVLPLFRKKSGENE